ncbi:hypothetical protein CYANOKiyG1_64460 [Okeania sp. KiyG1]|nr:hypothetical protein CYANOKiyG1_64460 [Okeania sp. KiyG1]
MSGSGTTTTDIPAAKAASIPAKESSNTKQFLGEAPNFSAAIKKISGAGFPCLRLGSSPTTI